MCTQRIGGSKFQPEDCMHGSSFGERFSVVPSRVLNQVDAIKEPVYAVYSTASGKVARVEHDEDVLLL